MVLELMELRGQAKETGMPNSIGYTPPFNQESSAKLSSSPMGSIIADSRSEPGHRSTTISGNQTLDHPHLTQHQDHLLKQHHHQQEQQLQHKHRDASPDPDPAPSLDTSETIAGAPNAMTTSTQPRLPPAVPTSSSNNSVQYRECLKNHAASMGGHVLDGCGEFMPSGEEGTPEALKCVACDCHRSFHRREVDGEPQTGKNHYSTYNTSRTNNSTHRTLIHPRPPPSLPAVPPQQQHQQLHKYTHGYTHVFNTSASTGHLAPVMMAFGGNGGAPAESSSEDLNMYQSNAGTQTAMQSSYSISKKRFRTKFTQQQKDKMHEFAEKLGWRIQKQDEQELHQFCDEVGVKRQVFKVWMHNNKQAMKKKQM